MSRCVRRLRFVSSIGAGIRCCALFHCLCGHLADAAVDRITFCAGSISATTTTTITITILNNVVAIGTLSRISSRPRIRAPWN
jgi:hypothetical protein